MISKPCKKKKTKQNCNSIIYTLPHLYLLYVHYRPEIKAVSLKNIKSQHLELKKKNGYLNFQLFCKYKIDIFDVLTS